MKGLIRNNFYMVEGSLKATLIFAIFSIILVVIVALNNMIVISPMLGGLFGGFGALAGTAAQKDAASKWNRFELTMPVSRIDIIKARYISFLLYDLIALILAIIGILSFYAVTKYLPLEEIGFGFTFGFCFALLLQASLFPLTLIFGSDKNESLLFVSVAISLGVYFGASFLAVILFHKVDTLDFLFRTGMIIFSIIFFIASYFFSTYIYNKKEL